MLMVSGSPGTGLGSDEFPFRVSVFLPVAFAVRCWGGEKKHQIFETLRTHHLVSGEICFKKMDSNQGQQARSSKSCLLQYTLIFEAY